MTLKMNRSLDLWVPRRANGRAKGSEMRMFNSSGERGVASARCALWIEESLERRAGDNLRKA